MDPSYLAERICSEHGFTCPLGLVELLAVCGMRGVPVRIGRFYGHGYYLTLPEPLILMDEFARPFVLAHELYHHIARDLSEWGGEDDEGVALYVFSENGRSRQERDANRFAELLCGEG